MSGQGLVRYCHECGHIGEVQKGKRDCCPDGSHAVLVPEKVAEQARDGSEMALFVYEFKGVMTRYRRLLEALS